MLKLKLDDLRLQQRLRSELLESRRGDLASLEKEYRQLETFEIQLRYDRLGLRASSVSTRRSL